MAQFNGMVVTNKGRELLARALASKGKFIITAAALGTGAYSGKLRECEELVNKKLDLILLGVYSEKGSTKITVGITNKNVSESFRTNEIGVYAKLEGDTESVLYAYDVAVEADTMPNNSLGTTLELVYDIYFDVSSEVEVTLEITDSIAFLTQDIAKREFLKTYIVSGGDLKGKVQLEADKQYLADDGKWYQNIGGDRVWEKSGVPDELLIEISWKTIMDEIAKKENKILVKNTAFNKNFGTAENEVLEGIQLARTLGLEYGGELNNSNTKKLNTVYYDTQNKSFFKCFRENTLNYADSSYYEGISNNDLLLKLQNLFSFYTRRNKELIINISLSENFCIASFFIEATNPASEFYFKTNETLINLFTEFNVRIRTPFQGAIGIIQGINENEKMPFYIRCNEDGKLTFVGNTNITGKHGTFGTVCFSIRK